MSKYRKNPVVIEAIQWNGNTNRQEICDFVSSYPGGGGCVRELIEKVLRAQGKWDLNTIGIW